MSDRKPVVLILCSQNSCRSQMAEALLRKHAGDRFEIHSAGLEAAPQIFPPARQVIEELGLDMSGQSVKSVDQFLGNLPVRYMIVVCDAAGKKCPTIWPGSPKMERLIWPFDDPAGIEGSDEEILAKCREVRDQIDQKLQEWLATLD